MENVDRKSVLIGMLLTVIAIMLMGQTSDNIGDITVNSISVIDENGIIRLNWEIDSAPVGIYNIVGTKNNYIPFRSEIIIRSN